MSSLLDGAGLGLVLVEFQYEYQDRDGAWVSIQPNERYALLAKTNAHWWQVRRRPDTKPFYIPAKYVRELPPAMPSPLDFVSPPTKALPPPVLPVPAVLLLPPSSSSPPSLKGAEPAADPRPGDEVAIRLRPAGAAHRRTENRLSTFGGQEPTDPLPSFMSPPWTLAGAPPPRGRTGLGLPQEDKPRVPSFSPADPLHPPRPHLPIAVETPVVPPPVAVETPVVPPPVVVETPVVPPPVAVETPVVPPPVAVETPVVPPPVAIETPVVPPPAVETPLKKQEEKEKQPEVEEQEAGVKRRRGGGEDGHHIYESIQDLNLDLDALWRDMKGTLGKEVFMSQKAILQPTPAQPPLPEEDYPVDVEKETRAHQLEKAGILNKTKVVDGGKRIRKNWAPSWTVLHGGILTFHRDPRTSNPSNSGKTSQIVPEYTVDLRGSALSWANRDKSSKKNVLELRTRHGCEYLVQNDTDSIIMDWHKVIMDAIQQLQEPDRLSEEEDEEGEDGIRTAGQTARTGETDHGRVRVKLRRFLQRRPTLQSVKEKGYIRDNVFGCHLDTLCHRENCTVPKFLDKCIRAVERRGLDVDGIYRVSGNLAVIQRLRHKADHEDGLDLDDGQWDEVHVVTGALKLFLRELPEPLFPFASFHKFIAAIQEPDYNQKVSFMKDLIDGLPLPNHHTMAALFRHLLKVIEHGEFNRMSVPSVSIVFGPTLLRPQVESAVHFTVHMVFQTRIVELILNEFHKLFPSH